MLRLLLLTAILSGTVLAGEVESTTVKDVGPTADILMRKIHGTTSKMALRDLVDGICDSLGLKVEVSESVAPKPVTMSSEEVTLAEFFKNVAGKANCAYKVKDGVIRFATADEFKADEDGTQKLKLYNKDTGPKLHPGNANLRISDFGFYIVDGDHGDTTEERLAEHSISTEDLPPLIDNLEEAIKTVPAASKDRCEMSLCDPLLKDLTFRPEPKTVGELVVRLTRVLKTAQIKVSQTVGDKAAPGPFENVITYNVLKRLKSETGCKLWLTPGDIDRPGSPDVPHVLWLYSPEELAKVQAGGPSPAEWKGEVHLPQPPAAAPAIPASESKKE